VSIQPATTRQSKDPTPIQLATAQKADRRFRRRAQHPYSTEEIGAFFAPHHFGTVQSRSGGDFPDKRISKSQA
jgi:hypothetical protein